MSYDFETITYGKWILAGEHAVLRGNPALVFPLKNKPLTLQYKKSNTPLKLNYKGESALTCEPSILALLEAAFTALSLDKKQINGELFIQNQVPIGTGLGASAALCVAITRLLKAIFSPDINIFEFAQSLENMFHGQSSGLDIAGSAAESQAVYFKSGHITAVTPTWTPHWCLSFSGTPSITSVCIEQVQTLRKKNQHAANQIDEQMARSVKNAHEALTEKNTPTQTKANINPFNKLTDAIQDASDCFNQWGLINQPLQAHMNALYEQGALAVKPTGSGNGGYVLSLWDKIPKYQPNIL